MLLIQKVLRGASMKIRNRRTYAQEVRKNRDSFGQSIITAATKWAGRMEKRLKGKTLTRGVIKATAPSVNNILYGYAVIFLSRHWAHGAKLASFHNMKEIQFL
jgi:hypothetical protein